MSSTIKKLSDKKLINPPSWLPNAVVLEVISGSIAYGIAEDSSDYDLYAVCIPKKDMVFFHLAGEIPGFGKQKKRFEQYSQHHVFDKDALGGRGREYDIQCFNIVKYFQLVMDGNPNCVDTLFVPRECILYSNQIGELIRQRRREFLHKGCYHKFRGYAFGQMSRATNAANSREVLNIREFEYEHGIPHTTTSAEIEDISFAQKYYLDTEEWNEYIDLWRVGLNKTKRFENQKIYGADTKFLAHLVRLCNECEQILAEGDLNLRKGSEQVKAVRNGEWTLSYVKKWFAEKEKTLEELYRTSKLPYGPDEPKIKQLLLKCLEQYFGSLDKCIQNVGKEQEILRQIKELVKDV